jgi:hypothetical protein
VIAGCGFARMAWKLAHHRTDYPLQRVLLDRLCARIVPQGPSAEYYRIIDAATVAWNSLEGSRPMRSDPRIAL